MDISQKLWLVDCLNGERAEVLTGPFTVGGGETANLKVNGPGIRGDRILFSVDRVGNGFQIMGPAGSGLVIYDGQELALATVEDNDEHTLVVGGHPFTLRYGDESCREWFSGISTDSWYLHQRGSQEWEGPFLRQILNTIADGTPGQVIVACRGMGQMGFFPHQIRQVLGGNSTVPVAQTEDIVAEEQFAVSEIDTEYGEFTCPTCWFRFGRGDVMSIAVHADLRGDSVLGEEHMLRFLATRFNDRGQPLDALGMAAPEHACPHCRRRLPPGFLDEPHHIFSMVGAPSSGKSYYLSVLVKLLQSTLFKSFATTFRDASPSDNVVLNDMKTHLFSASSPEDAYLAKTELEGALYETLPRQGRQVRLPKPFVFRVSRQDDSDEGFSLVFYDNAGEHFEPGRNSADSPGAQHIAVASGVFFLFDPLYNPEFRRRIESSDDPQLEERRNDQQDIILSESEVRMKQLLGLASAEKVATPLAVIIGKSDSWISLLGDESLLPVLGEQDGVTRVLVSNIEKNSDRIREFLMEVCPEIVANAEGMSSDVRFFAASPLGNPPVKFTDTDGVERIGPDPTKLDPQRVEDATLWVLSKIAPTFFPRDNPS
ncbi:MAG: hypothetical protein CMN03_04430 [Roseibacillus sp.]|nr:hypothetical protein [Roseibacillus sp.]